jgi:NDP-sugar pyrophosphorylase family protein
LKTFLEWHYMKNAEATLLLAEVSAAGRYGRVHVDEKGLVLRFEEKDGRNVPGLINAGIYLIKRQALYSIPESGIVSLERTTFPEWIGRRFYGYRSHGRFLDIGTPESYALTEQFFGSPILK